MKKLLIAFIIISNFYSARSQDHFIGLRVYHENDFLNPIGNNKDDNYTGGLKAELVTNLLNPLCNAAFGRWGWQSVMQSFSFSVTAFTPEDLANPNIILAERPYASYRSWNFGASFVHSDSTRRFSFELQLGAMGRPAAGEAQTYIHEHHWFGSQRPIPQGWGYEIADGGVFAANLQLSYAQKITNKQRVNGPQIVWLHELNIGQYMSNYMQGLRFYILNINNDVVRGEGIPAISAIYKNGNSRKVGFSLFATPRLKSIFHNATITGKLLGRSSPHTLPSLDLNRAVMEYDACAVVRVCFLRLGYFLYGRSREYKGEEKSFHNWGGPYIGIIAKF